MPRWPRPTYLVSILVSVTAARISQRRQATKPGDQPGPVAVHAVWSQLALAATPPEERSREEPAAAPARPGTGGCRQVRQVRAPQPGPQPGGRCELPQPGGQRQREQHSQARCGRDNHRGGRQLGPQPQQAQAQPHQRQHRHIGTAIGERDAAAGYTTWWPTGCAHCDRGGAAAILAPPPCLKPPGPVVPAARWATMWPEGLAAASWAAPARSARGPLPPPAAVHPVMRTAIAPSSAPARPVRARTCELVIAPPGMAQVVPI
jgi:hypothetical protein